LTSINSFRCDRNENKFMGLNEYFTVISGGNDSNSRGSESILEYDNEGNKTKSLVSYKNTTDKSVTINISAMYTYEYLFDKKEQGRSKYTKIHSNQLKLFK